MRSSVLYLAGLAALGFACQRTDRGTSAPTASTAIVAAPTTPNASLRETRWELRRLASLPVAEVAGDRQPYLLISAAGTAQGQGSCNLFRSVVQPAANDGELQFAPLQSTRMACPTLSTEQLFTKAIQATRAYRIVGDTLWLYGNSERSGTALARLVATSAQ